MVWLSFFSTLTSRKKEQNYIMMDKHIYGDSMSYQDVICIANGDAQVLKFCKICN